MIDKHRWIITTLLAVVIVVADLALLYYASKKSWLPLTTAIIGVGIITFFGMLTTAKFQSIGNGSKNDKGHMRTAITGMLLCVYIAIVLLVAGGNFSDNQGVIMTNSTIITITEINKTKTTTINNTSTVFESNQGKIIDNFTNVILVIIGFYFGTRTIQEVLSKRKDGEDSKSEEKSQPEDPVDTIKKLDNKLKDISTLEKSFEGEPKIKEKLKEIADKIKKEIKKILGVKDG